MTVGKKLHQTLASLRGAKADMEAFAMETQNKNAQQLYSSTAQQLGQVVDSLSQRTNEVESQEPQYKVKQNMQNKQGQGQ